MSKGKTTALAPDESRELQVRLEAEEAAYRRLLRLAVRQNRYLRRQDLDRLGNNAGDWGRHRPAASRRGRPASRT